MIRTRVVLIVAALGALAGIDTAAANTVGTFTWQLQPFCNRIVATVTENGGVYTLDGYDDQCGAGQRAPLVGVATLNPDGTIGLGLNIVTTPGGKPVHVDARVTLPSASGSWSDSDGNTGTFLLGGGGSGPRRPEPASALLTVGSVTSATIANGTIVAADVDLTQLQRRVDGTCEGGQAVARINNDGSVGCSAIVSAGDITDVLPGIGLTGGASSGVATLSASFSGDGMANTVARSDHRHTHVLDSSSTAVGAGALNSAASGSKNTAVGANTLRDATTAFNNTAVGTAALQSLRTGSGNVAVGIGALGTRTDAAGLVAIGTSALGVSSTGVSSTAIGRTALASNTTGGFNTAVGASALEDNVAGSENTALGAFALYLGDAGSSNTAVGRSALSGAEGNDNTGIGARALLLNVSGVGSTAVGADALLTATGGDNIAIGRNAGRNLTTGSGNIYLGHAGIAADAQTMRLGSAQTKTYIAGIRTTPATVVPSGLTVYVGTDGLLGTISSSRRFKTSIEDMGGYSGRVLRLRPVTFTYTHGVAPGADPRDFGLIAEEVAEVFPELAVRGADGEIESVAYHKLPALLLNEVQRQERTIDALTSALEALRAELAALRTTSPKE